MFYTKKKTQAEIDGEALDTAMPAKEYNKKYMRGSKTLWHCETCQVLFSEDDIIIARVHGKENEPRCALLVDSHYTHWFKKRVRKKMCLNRLMFSDFGYWQKNYHLSHVTPQPTDGN